MQLTQKQESLISRYLRDRAMQLDDSLPEKTRERNLRQLQMTIYRDLEALPAGSIRDEDVLAVLRHTASNAQAASPNPNASQQSSTINRQSAGIAPPKKSRQHRKAPPESTVAPVWLGVCAFNADRFGLSPWILRLGTVLLGLVTGPVAVIFYLVAYIEFYQLSDKKERPPIAYGQLILRTIAPLAIAIVLRWGTYKLLDLIAYGYQQVFGEAPPPLGKWDWLTFNEGTLFFLLWTSVIPLSILSGLPLANAWGHSLKRLAQALVALYFMALCFGIASVLVGLILNQVLPYMQ